MLSRSKEKKAHYIVAVRALDEGVNLPHLSTYIDLNANVSVKQMVHRIGRVLRLYPGKIGSDILFLSDYRDAENAGDLLSLLDIMEMSSEFSGGIRIRQESGDTRFRSGEVEPLSRQQLLELRKELEASVRSFWSKKTKPSLDEMIEILQRKGVRTETEYKKRRKTDPELQNLPSELPQAYKVKWSDIKKRLGLVVVRQITKENKPSLEEALNILQRKGIRTWTEYTEQRKTDPELQSLPSHLPQSYNLKWSDIQEQLGLVARVTEENKPLLDEFLNILQRKGIRTWTEYKERRKTDPELQHLPVSLTQSYNLKWSDIRKRLGLAIRITQENKPLLDEIIEILKRKGIRTEREYLKRRKTDPELQSLPSDLHRSYKMKWSEIKKRLGLTVVRRITQANRPSFEDALKVLRRKGIRTQREYLEGRKTDPELQNLPSELSRVYKMKWSNIKSLLEVGS